MENTHPNQQETLPARIRGRPTFAFRRQGKVDESRPQQKGGGSLSTMDPLEPSPIAAAESIVFFFVALVFWFGKALEHIVNSNHAAMHKKT